MRCCDTLYRYRSQKWILRKLDLNIISIIGDGWSGSSISLIHLDTLKVVES